jgi:hypothetical protein
MKRWVVTSRREVIGGLNHGMLGYFLLSSTLNLMAIGRIVVMLHLICLTLLAVLASLKMAREFLILTAAGALLLEMSHNEEIGRKDGRDAPLHH